MAAQAEKITLWINGQTKTLPSCIRLNELLLELNIPQAGTAVELAGEIVPQGSYQSIELQDGARLEIVRLVGGG